MEHHTVHKPEDLLPFMPQILQASEIALHAEMTASRSGGLHTLHLATTNIPPISIDCRTFLPEGTTLLHEALSTHAVKVLFNAKTVIGCLLPYGIHLRPLFDGMLAAQLLYQPPDQYRFDLPHVAKQCLDASLPGLGDDNRNGNLRPALAEAGAQIAQLLLQLRSAMIPELQRQGLVRIAEIEFRCVQAIGHMECHGIHLDRQRWQELRDKTEAERTAALERLYEYTGHPMEQLSLWGEGEALNLNFDSNKFVRALLNDNGIPVASTGKQELHPFRDHPLVQALSAYRKAAKSVSSFLQPYPALIDLETGRLHPSYGQISTYSGRMSCVDPNIQQIPRDAAFRQCFTAPPGRCLIIADYSQIELRAAAQISRDERMLAACQEGRDLHALTASLLTGKPEGQVSKMERQSAKAVNFGLIFGMGAQGLQKYAQSSYGVPMSLEQAVLFRERFFEAYQGIDQWHKHLKAHPEREGRTLSGRRFTFPHTPTLPEMANLPVQGTAADIVKKALGTIAERIEGTDTLIVAVVHDEILLECAEDRAAEMKALLTTEMEDAARSILPQAAAEVEAVIAGSWAGK